MIGTLPTLDLLDRSRDQSQRDRKKHIFPVDVLDVEQCDVQMFKTLECERTYPKVDKNTFYDRKICFTSFANGTLEFVFNPAGIVDAFCAQNLPVEDSPFGGSAP